MERKKIDTRKLTGQLGINLIERVVLKIGFAWHPTNPELEAGIDGYIEIRDPATDEATNCIVQVQSRSLKEFTAETKTSFEYVCRQRDIDYWLAGNAPVILVVSRSGTDEAYWVAVKSYFADSVKRSSRRIVFEKASQRFTVHCRQPLIDLAVPVDSGIYFAPLPRTEGLFSNLLPVTHYPPQVFVGSTDLRYPGQVWSRAKELGVRLGGEWILKGKQLHSFHDLREPPWDRFCDRGTVEADPSASWALSNESDLRNDFVHLARRCLMEKLWPLHIGYLADLDIFFFRAAPNLTIRQLRYPSLKRTAARTVFSPYESKTTAGRTAYYRHSAFQGFFRRFDDKWYLEITPTYY